MSLKLNSGLGNNLERSCKDILRVWNEMTLVNKKVPMSNFYKTKFELLIN